MAWPNDPAVTPEMMLQQILAFASEPPRDVDPLWQQVSAHASFCLTNLDHGFHPLVPAEVRRWQVARAWAEIDRKGPLADACFVLGELNHGEGG